jgi:cyclopropane-fatty-acyl-phospholipid synthase
VATSLLAIVALTGIARSQDPIETVRIDSDLVDLRVSEMIEAVGEKYWPTYFGAIDSLLAPGGKVVIQAILLGHDRYLATRDTYTWIHKYIFPGGLLPSVEAIEQVVGEHTTLGVAEVFPLGQHYGHTLRLWREQFLASWPQVAALGFSDTFRRMWEFYLAYCEAGFRAGYLEVAQIRLERPAAGGS